VIGSCKKNPSISYLNISNRDRNVQIWSVIISATETCLTKRDEVLVFTTKYRNAENTEMQEKCKTS